MKNEITPKIMQLIVDELEQSLNYFDAEFTIIDETIEVDRDGAKDYLVVTSEEDKDYVMTFEHKQHTFYITKHVVED